MPAPPTVQPLDQFTEIALVKGTVPGAIVNLHVNGVWLTSADATPAASSTRIPLPRRLRPGDQVTASQIAGGASSGFSVATSVELNHVTYQFDNFRTGWNPYEAVLNTANVKPPLFGLLFEHVVDAPVYAQPLYVQNVPIAGKGVHNVVFVATQACTVYAFDADGATGTNATWLWKRSLLASGERPMFTWDTAAVPAQIKPIANPDWSFPVPALADLNCGNLYPLVGITSTPVIDRTTNTLYLAAKTFDGTNFHWRLRAIDLTTGIDRTTAPYVEMSGSVPGTGIGSVGGTIQFQPQWANQRSALLLSRGIVYVAFASHCDWGPPTRPDPRQPGVIGSDEQYHGWLLAYEADTLNPVGIFCATPDWGQGGIWNGGYGPAAGPDGFAYVVTGNGNFVAGRDYGNSVIQLGADLSVASYFTPHDQAWLTANDLDLGSGGAMIVPNQPTSSSYLVVAAGKTGTIYVMEPGNMGGFNAAADSCRQHLDGAIGNPPGTDHGMYGGPGFYQGPKGQFVFYAADSDNLKAFAVKAGVLATTPSKSARTFPDGGAVPTITTNGSTPASGVLWLLQRTDPITLVAIDASNVSAELSATSVGSWIDPGSGRYAVPTTIHGNVYCAISTLLPLSPTSFVPGGKLKVFGLLPPLGRFIVTVTPSTIQMNRPTPITITAVDSVTNAPVRGSSIVITNYTAPRPPRGGGDAVTVRHSAEAPFSTTITFHYGREYDPETRVTNYDIEPDITVTAPNYIDASALIVFIK